jgi:hypothetical protein
VLFWGNEVNDDDLYGPSQILQLTVNLSGHWALLFCFCLLTQNPDAVLLPPCFSVMVAGSHLLHSSAWMGWLKHGSKLVNLQRHKRDLA